MHFWKCGLLWPLPSLKVNTKGLVHNILLTISIVTFTWDVKATIVASHIMAHGDENMFTPYYCISSPHLQAVMHEHGTESLVHTVCTCSFPNDIWQAETVINLFHYTSKSISLVWKKTATNHTLWENSKEVIKPLSSSLVENTHSSIPPTYNCYDMCIWMMESVPVKFTNCLKRVDTDGY